MNFGERLKQIRTAQGLTQPQFAQLAGIEQSYLSKLENDKSVPSAEMFSTILSGLGVDAASFLSEVDQEVQAHTLRHIPAVVQVNASAALSQVHQTKRWLFGSALAWVLGFAMMLAANDGIFFPTALYTYSSPGVLRPGEPENLYDSYKELLLLRLQARTMTQEQVAQAMAEFQANRARPLTVDLPANRGTSYVEAAADGHRRYQYVKLTYVKSTGNRILQYLGAIVLVCGCAGLFIEWRLRRLKNKTR